MSRSYTSSPPRAFVACSGTALALDVFTALNSPLILEEQFANGVNIITMSRCEMDSND
jgi:hypothetical protein